MSEDNALNKTLGVGFLGAGPVTQAIHLPTLSMLPEIFHVAAVMDVSEQVAVSVASRVGAKATTSAEELLADPDVEIVVICSPNDFHAERVEAACKAGKKAVLCEKPFAVSRDEAERIAQVSTETGVPVIVGTMHTFDSGWADLAERLDVLADDVHTVRSTAGHGDVAWEPIFRTLNAIGYDGPTSIEWEDAGMDRLIGAPQALAMVRDLATIQRPAAAFDAAFRTQ